MSADLTKLAPRLSELVSSSLGLHFGAQRWPELARGIEAAADESGGADSVAFAQRLLSVRLTRREVELLARHLTVGESYFFRERECFAALETCILPQLVGERRGESRRLRIWSAGCCTGEEPYSLAMTLTRAIPDLAEWDVVILATDVNVRSLELATRGEFGEWSFRGVPSAEKFAYFTTSRAGRYTVAPHIRRLVHFKYLNLADASAFGSPDLLGAFDVIFCRNVLMYLTPDHAQGVAARLTRALNAGGWLFVGATETSSTLFPDVHSVQFRGAFAYRRPMAQRGDAARAGGQLDQGAPPPRAFGWRTLSTDRLTVDPAFQAAPARPAVDADARFAASAASGEVCSSDSSAALASDSDGLCCPRAEASALARLARTCADRGDLDEALSCCDAAIAADKLEPTIYYLRAVILQDHGRPAEAKASLLRAIYLAPDFVMAHFLLSHILVREGKPHRAARHLERVQSLLRDVPSDRVLRESEGISAGRLLEVVRAGLRPELVA